MAAIFDLPYTVIRDHLTDKHLGDFSCPETHWLSGSEKLPYHSFANESTSVVQDHSSKDGIVQGLASLLCASLRMEDFITD